MSIEDVRLVKKVFDGFDKDGSDSLDVDEFEQAVVKLLQLQLMDPSQAVERAKGASSWCWFDADEDTSGTISFREFLKWYCSNGFKEDLLLTETERWLRQMAKKYGVSTDSVDSIKHWFDTYDVDHSGQIDLEEFGLVLHKALKVPPHLELPLTRVHHFWKEIDADGSGSANFEEFLQWWLRYFSTGTTDAQELPFETLYRQVRRMGAKYMDPPAYPSLSSLTPNGEEEVED